MTPLQLQLVQDSWEKVVPIADTAADLFYNRLFEIAPHTRQLFSGDIAEQGKKLMSILTTVVRGLQNLSALEETVWQLGRRHTLYNVKDEDYQPVAEALLWTLGQGLGDDFTEEVKAAWVEAYTILATVMQGGSDSSYANYADWKAAQ